MSHENGNDPGGERKLTLDALFADQPFLSATMKAQLLHQKLREQAPADAEAGLPSQAVIGEPALRLVTPVEADRAAESIPDESDPATVDLMRAAGFLRAGCPPGRLPGDVSATLTAFRRGTLARWLAAAPPPSDS